MMLVTLEAKAIENSVRTTTNAWEDTTSHRVTPRAQCNKGGGVGQAAAQILTRI